MKRRTVDLRLSDGHTAAQEQFYDADERKWYGVYKGPLRASCVHKLMLHVGTRETPAVVYITDVTRCTRTGEPLLWFADTVPGARPKTLKPNPASGQQSAPACGGFVAVHTIKDKEKDKEGVVVMPSVAALAHAADVAAAYYTHEPLHPQQYWDPFVDTDGVVAAPPIAGAVPEDEGTEGTEDKEDNEDLPTSTAAKRAKPEDGSAPPPAPGPSPAPAPKPTTGLGKPTTAATLTSSTSSTSSSTTKRAAAQHAAVALALAAAGDETEDEDYGTKGTKGTKGTEERPFTADDKREFNDAIVALGPAEVRHALVLDADGCNTTVKIMQKWPAATVYIVNRRLDKLKAIHATLAKSPELEPHLGRIVVWPGELVDFVATFCGTECKAAAGTGSSTGSGTGSSTDTGTGKAKAKGIVFDVIAADFCETYEGAKDSAATAPSAVMEQVFAQGRVALAEGGLLALTVCMRDRAGRSGAGTRAWDAVKEAATRGGVKLAYSSTIKSDKCESVFGTCVSVSPVSLPPVPSAGVPAVVSAASSTEPSAAPPAPPAQPPALPQPKTAAAPSFPSFPSSALPPPSPFALAGMFPPAPSPVHTAWAMAAWLSALGMPPMPVPSAVSQS